MMEGCCRRSSAGLFVSEKKTRSPYASSLLARSSASSEGRRGNRFFYISLAHPPLSLDSSCSRGDESLLFRFAFITFRRASISRARSPGWLDDGVFFLSARTVFSFLRRPCLLSERVCSAEKHLSSQSPSFRPPAPPRLPILDEGRLHVADKSLHAPRRCLPHRPVALAAWVQFPFGALASHAS